MIPISLSKVLFKDLWIKWEGNRPSFTPSLVFKGQIEDCLSLALAEYLSEVTYRIFEGLYQLYLLLNNYCIFKSPSINLITLEMFCSDWMLTFVLYWKHITCLVLKALYDVIIWFGQTDRCLSSCKDHQCVSNLIALLICNKRWSLV